MKAFAVVHKGVEKIASLELEEKGALGIRASGSVIEFEAKSEKDLCSIAYTSQSVSRLCAFVCEFKADKELPKTIENLKSQLNGFRIGDWIDGSDSFSVEVDRYGSHDFNSLNLSVSANKMLAEVTGNVNVSFKSPKLQFYCRIDYDVGFFGVDILGFDSSKRDYRIFGHSADMKSTVAYALLRIVGFSKKSLLLDPMARSGAISIEAAFFACGFPVNYHRRDSMAFLNLRPFAKIDFSRLFGAVDKKISDGAFVFNFSPVIAHLRNCEKNAKIAGVNKFIKFSRIDLQNIDLKFKDGSVGCIVSFPPLISKRADDAKVLAEYRELFRQAKFLLAEQGRIVILGRNIENYKESAKGLRLVSSHDFPHGDSELAAFVFAKD